MSDPRCSIIIPVRDNALLTEECLETVLAPIGEGIGPEREVIVVDDGSRDAETARVLERFADRIQVLRNEESVGFGRACNAGAAASRGEFFVFLNNDTVPQAGWLAALVRYADEHPQAGVVGCKLLYPDGRVQHAGVVVCQDRYVRHLYTGLPGDHEAVNKSRPFQAVTFACALVRREAFERAGGFDTGFTNGYEDVDLCFRLGELGYEVHYCHESVVWHHESMTEGRFAHTNDNDVLYRNRWAHRLRADDLDYWLEDGLLRFDYGDFYPVEAYLSPLVAAVGDEERLPELERLLTKRGRQVFRLLRRNAQLDLRTRSADSELEKTREELKRARDEEAAATRRALEEQAETTRAALEAQTAATRKALESLSRKLDRISRRDAETRRMLTELAERQEAQTEETREAVLAEVQRIEDSIHEVHELVDEHMRPEPGDHEVPYDALVRRIRKLVRQELPAKATVAVVSRGDDAVLDLGRRTGWHFPRSADGSWAGYYPAADISAIAHLEAVRARGADHLLVPETSFWWLDHYPEFARHLESRYQAVLRDEDACIAWSLAEVQEPAQSGWRALDEVLAECRARLGRPPAVLDWDSGLDLERALPEFRIFKPSPSGPVLPYVDGSVDLVVVRSADDLTLAEAARVSSEAVVAVSPSSNGGGPLIDVRWQSNRGAERLPSTSIVIPVHDALAYTEACLRTLRETLPREFEGEIVVVDDLSSEETARRLRELARTDDRLRILRNETNLGFLQSSNRGAFESESEIILFLNNDTVLLPGWLPPMLQLFQQRPDAGVVGGRLLFEDGTLQEGGGLIFRDASAAHFGRGDPNPDNPLYTYVREVDYCSGALFATRRDLFTELGGFDEQYSPGYCEDSDYCFAVRSLGYRVYYQPAATIVHVEGGTAGTDLTQGAKRYQVLNKAALAEKWAEALAHQPVRPDDADGAAWKALAVRTAAGSVA